MNATAVVTRPRLHWVDVMKVLGMFFIIYGHLFTYGYQYAYAFNVPVFFVLSGFLFKEDQSASEFWRKLWWQLAVPMLAICVLNNTYLIVNDLLHHRLDTSRFLFPLGMLAGEHRFLDVCWFIYTLILLKIISFFVRRNGLRILVAINFLVAAFFLAPMVQAHDWRMRCFAFCLLTPSSWSDIWSRRVASRRNRCPGGRASPECSCPWLHCFSSCGRTARFFSIVSSSEIISPCACWAEWPERRCSFSCPNCSTSRSAGSGRWPWDPS